MTREQNAAALAGAIRKLLAEDEPRVIATFNSYAGMLEAIRARVHELQVNGERLDEYVGLPRGYYSKVAGARPIRRLGMTSFAPILNGLGLKCQFIEDPIGTERLKSRVPPRNASYVRTMPAAAGILFTARMLKRIRRLGGIARMAKLTPEQRSELGKKAAAARWKGGMSALCQRRTSRRRAGRRSPGHQRDHACSQERMPLVRLPA